MAVTETRSSARTLQTRAIHAYVSAVDPTDGRAGMAVIFTDSRGRVVRRTGRMLPGVASKDLASFRGILHALWNSRRLGSRWVVVHSDNRDVVAQINGTKDVDPALIGPYLEVRALLHAYRGARVDAGETIWGHEAAAIAQDARKHDSDDIVEDLPLWAGQPMLERSSA